MTDIIDKYWDLVAQRGILKKEYEDKLAALNGELQKLRDEYRVVHSGNIALRR